MYQSTLENRDSRHSVRSPGFGALALTAMAVVVGPVAAMVVLSRPTVGAVFAAAVISAALARRVRRQGTGVEGDDEALSARVHAPEQLLMKLRGRWNTDQ